MNQSISNICFIGIVFSILTLISNKGYRSANIFLGGYLFFASVYLTECYTILYSSNTTLVAFFTNTRPFFYLIAPFSYFYIRSILTDSSKLNKLDYLHFILFAISFTGIIPYWFSNWDYKIEIAKNIQSEAWNTSLYKMNFFLSRNVDQVLSVIQVFFYTFFQWRLFYNYIKKSNKSLIHNTQFKLIKKWVVFNNIIFTLIAINFCFAIVSLWIYDQKSIFLNRSYYIILFSAFNYILLNLTLLAFPQILYGYPLSIEIKHDSIDTESVSDESHILVKDMKIKPKLFSELYISQIEGYLMDIIDNQKYLSPDFNLTKIAIDYKIQPHHLTYYFNEIIGGGFSSWRNHQRISYAKKCIDEGILATITLEGLSLQCGFHSQNTFIRCFNKIVGCNPSYYAKFKG